MKHSLLAMLLMLMSIGANAQSTYNVSGTILEDETNEVVIAATVRILSLPDSSMVAGAATTTDGSFNIKKVKAGKYALKITYIGYRTRVLELDLTNKKDKNVELGYMYIIPDSKMMKEVTVSANAAQVQVKGDSLVYNASAYRVPEGSVLEDLIKKLPGAKVDENGNITINGKTMKKILVEGKEFFLDDPNMALKNIPTNMIDKIKTYDRKSDFARVTSIDDGEEETVLDLTVKKGMNNGWFGNFDAGYGTEDRWSNRITVNRFTDNSQYTLTGGANNTGDMGFGGGGGRGGWGGRGGGGLRNSKTAGFNFAKDTEKLEIGGNIRYQYNGSDSKSWQTQQRFDMGTTSDASNTTWSNSFSGSRSSANNFNGNFRLEWRPDSMTNVIFRPSGSFTRNKGFSDSQSAEFDEDPNDLAESPLDSVFNATNRIDQLMDMLVNTNDSRSQSYSENKRLNGELQLNRRLNNYGRNLTLRMTGNIGSSTSKNLSGSDVSQMTVNRETGLKDPRYTVTNRYNYTPNKNRSFGAQLSYSEPIADRTYLQVSYRYDYSYQKSDRRVNAMDPSTFNMLKEALGNYRYNITGALDYLMSQGVELYGPEGTDSLNVLAKRQGQFSEYNNYNHTISLSFRKITDYYNFNIGVDLLPQRSKLDYVYLDTDTTVTRNVFMFSPNIDFRYNFTQQTNLRFNYRGRASQPSMTNLVDVKDDTNPMRITQGNSGLKPSFTHNINFNFNTFQMEHQRSIFAWGGVNFTQNSIANRTIVDRNDGNKSKSKPFNVNGNWSGNIGVGFNSSLDANNYFTMNTFTNFNYNHQVGLQAPSGTSIGENDPGIKTFTNTTGVNENLGFDFRKDWFEFGVNGSVGYNNTKSSVGMNTNQENWTFTYGAEMSLIFNNGLSVNTDISQSSRRGMQSSALNTNEWLWNASASMSFLKGNALTVSLSWNDILHQQTNISRAISASTITDSRQNGIFSYGMLRLIYKLNIFGGKNSNGTSNARNGWGGFGGGGRGGNFGGGGPGGNFGGGGRGR